MSSNNNQFPGRNYTRNQSQQQQQTFPSASSSQNDDYYRNEQSIDSSYRSQGSDNHYQDNNRSNHSQRNDNYNNNNSNSNFYQNNNNNNNSNSIHSSYSRTEKYIPPRLRKLQHSYPQQESHHYDQGPSRQIDSSSNVENSRTRDDYASRNDYDYREDYQDRRDDYGCNRVERYGQNGGNDQQMNAERRYDSQFNPNSAPYYLQDSHASTSHYRYSSTISSYPSSTNVRAYSTSSQSQAPYNSQSSNRPRSPSRSDYDSRRSIYNYNSDLPPLDTHSNPNSGPRTPPQSQPRYNGNPSSPNSPRNSGYSTPNKWVQRPPGPRKKMDRSIPTALPSQSYLDITLLPTSSNSSHTISKKSSKLDPPFLVLDLNNTLLCRATRTSHGSRNATLRPHLSTFLSYLCGSTSSTSPRSPTWQSIIYSSARSTNVLQMLLGMSLISPSRLATHQSGTPWTCQVGDPLTLVWSRENMGLSEAEFNEDVKTVKDLEGVWKTLGVEKGEETLQGGVRRTVLLDDESEKAALQPYNHLPISPFSPANHLKAASSAYRRPRERSASPYPSSIPSSTPLTPTSTSTTPSKSSTPNLRAPSPPPSASELLIPEVDQSLLSTIYLLEILKKEKNIPAFIRNDGLNEFYAEGEDELIRRGRQVCQEMGIRVDEQGEWDSDWRIR